MAAKALPSQEVLRQLLDYNPDTGALTWRRRGVEWFTDGNRQKAQHFAARWNSAYAGREALASISAGYKTGTMFGLTWSAHRIIWRLVYGTEPDNIDHINGQTTDNRLQNLRSITKAENARNHKTRKDNASGMVGIHIARSGRWIAQAKGKYIGCFDTLEAALAARKQAEREFGFHENHGRAA